MFDLVSLGLEAGVARLCIRVVVLKSAHDEDRAVISSDFFDSRRAGR